MSDAKGRRAINGTGVRVISRAAQVLRALDGLPEGLSLSEIASRVDLPRSTVHRVVTALQDEGFVAAVSPNGKVRLGAELLRLASGRHRDLKQDLRPIMQSIFRELDETVDLAILEGEHLTFIDQVAAPHRLRTVSSVGASFPLYCTANGKAVLAVLSPDALAGLLPARLSPMTPTTITSRKALLSELETIRETGIGLDREEHTEGIAAAGFAVRDDIGGIAAISVPMPTQRFAHREKQVIATLQKARETAQRAVTGS